MNSNRVLVSLLLLAAVWWTSCGPTSPPLCSDAECLLDAGAGGGANPIGGGATAGGGSAGGSETAGGSSVMAGGSAGGSSETGGGSSTGGGSVLDAGEVDAGSCELHRWFVDADQDGYGLSEVSACLAPPGTVAQGGDCDDRNPAVNPGEVEVCDALLVDENCRAGANEGCGCVGLGSTRPCCSGRGQQVCVASDAGSTYSSCDAPTSIERCNGLDDDCNGQVDDLGTTDGGIDAGEPGATCSVGVGACRRSTMLTCSSAMVVCAIDAGIPGVEQCNGVDDDCDGQVDDGTSLCAISGQSCVAGACLCPQGESVCGSACAAVGRACSAGVGACRTSGVEQCTSGALQCSAVPGTPRTESCNAIDDDCDGLVDEAGPQLCTATGQLCTSGSCSCPSGQGVCGGACTQLVQCVVDADDDGYAGGTVTRALCPDPTRAATFGSCPAGFIAPANSSGADCDDTNASLVQVAATRTDADGDLACSGPSVSSCLGRTAPAGRRFIASCASEDDCNDADSTRFRMLSIAGDADRDTHCTAPLTATCIGTNVPTGFTTSCVDSTDCNDADTTKFRMVSIAGDADGDTHCTGPLTATCIGTNVPSGFGTSCIDSTDCNDSDSTKFRTLSIAGDADGDTHCSGPLSATCIGTNVPAGFTTSCVDSTDCNDSDTSRFRIASIAGDADGDGHCTGPLTATCIGTNLPAGFTASCIDAIECNDSDRTTYQLLTVRPDQDGDTFCSSSAASARCSGATPGVGFRLASTCAGTDCNDADRTTYQLLTVREDGDGDSRCYGPEQFQCAGASPAPGFRVSAGCLDDCNDANPSAYQLISVRTDSDGDGACVGGVFGRCSGASVDPGFRATAACAPFNDCNDNNFNAGEVCALAYQTSTASKSCGIGPPPKEYLSVSVSSPSGGCPVGFQLVNLHADLVGGLPGSCNPFSPTVIEMTCPGASFGSMQCTLRGTCSAF